MFRENSINPSTSLGLLQAKKDLLPNPKEAGSGWCLMSPKNVMLSLLGISGNREMGD